MNSMNLVANYKREYILNADRKRMKASLRFLPSDEQEYNLIPVDELHAAYNEANPPVPLDAFIAGLLGLGLIVAFQHNSGKRLVMGLCD